MVAINRVKYVIPYDSSAGVSANVTTKRQPQRTRKQCNVRHGVTLFAQAGTYNS